MRAMCAQASRPAAVRSAMFAKGKAGVYDPNDARVKPGAKRPGLKLTYEPHTKEAKAAGKAAKKAVAAKAQTRADSSRFFPRRALSADMQRDGRVAQDAVWADRCRRPADVLL